MRQGGGIGRRPSVRRMSELLVTVQNGARLLRGSRLTDEQGGHSLTAEAEAGLRDALATAVLPREWRLGDRLTTVGDVAVVEVRGGADLTAVLKLSRSPAGDASLLKQLEVLDRLRTDPRLDAWQHLLPGVLARGRAGRHLYAVEQAVPGVSGDRLRDALTDADTLRRAAVAVAGLHRATGGPAVVTREMVDGWVEPALSLITDVAIVRSHRRRIELVAALRRRLGAALEGRRVWVGCTHGDYTPGNIIYDGSGVRGIIDWAQSRDDDAALIDPMTLLIFSRALTERAHLGRVVLDLCRGAPLTSGEVALVEAHREVCPADPVPVEIMALLAWLRHVETNLVKSPRYASHPVWVRRNVEVVLSAVAGSAAGGRLRAERVHGRES